MSCHAVSILVLLLYMHFLCMKNISFIVKSFIFEVIKYHLKKIIVWALKMLDCLPWTLLETFI